MRGREVALRRELCRHAWVVVVEEGVTVLLECDFCGAVVGCTVGCLAHGGHSFGFYPVEGSVSGDDYAALGEWFGQRVGQCVALHVDMRSVRHRRRSPVRAA